MTKSDSESSDSDKDEEVHVEGSNVYFYADVSSESISNLIRKLKILDKKLRKKAIDLDGYKPKIKLYIRSDGGDVYAGFSGMDHITGLKTPVITIADGYCASAATFLLMAGSKRIATPSTYILIHQITSGSFWGKYEELKEEMETCDKLMNKLKNIYTTKTEIPEKTLKKLFKKDIMLNAEKCLEYKIVDKIAYP